MVKTPLYRLIYFNSRGAVELTRYLLVAVEAPYDDMRYPLQASSKGFGISADGDFLAHQQAGHFDVNMGSLPILQVLTSDGKAAIATLGQSHAINRFLAERHGYFGQDLVERAQIDSFYESIRDTRSSYLSSKRKSSSEAWLEEKLPEYCTKLEKSLPPSRSDVPWLIGKSTSLADIAVYSLLGTATSAVTGDRVSGLDGFDPSGALKVAPRLEASIQAVSELSSIQRWERERPDTFS